MAAATRVLHPIRSSMLLDASKTRGAVVGRDSVSYGLHVQPVDPSDELENPWNLTGGDSS